MSEKPLVAIVMGSESDRPVMKDAGEVLEDLGIPYHQEVMSAHRTPKKVAEFACSARDQGIQVIIAGAGGAAHLAGAIAAHTTLPVIGIPIQTQALDGLDSLLSIVQMPKGVPVATVAINGARNAGILAAQMLALGDEKIGQRLAQMKQEMAKPAKGKSS